MIAVLIIGLVTALEVLWWRAAEEIRRAYLEMKMEMAVAEARARSAEQRAIAAEARVKLLELQAKAVRDVDGDQDTSQKPPSRRPSVVQ